MKGVAADETTWAERVRTLAFFVLALVVAASLGVLWATPAHAATFTVTSTGDENDLDFPGGTFDNFSDGKCDVNPGTAGDQCTLRAAIQQVNVTSGADTINFAIPNAGPHTISPTSALPDISEAMTINGYSESLDETTPATANTQVIGNNAVLKIELSGADAPINTIGQKPSGLKIKASNSTVKGLVINEWESGIHIATGATRNKVQGNYIGTDATGTVTNPDGIPFNGDELGNTAGVVALGDNNTIGGTTAAARNIISGNGAGVHIVSAMGGNQVMGNHIGTNASGTEALGNTNGVVIDSAPNNSIGGTTAGARNVISGNAIFGIRIAFTGATLNKVQGNYVGISAAGDTELANGNDGVRIQADADDNTIGGATSGAGNIISGNGSDGVEVRYDSGVDTSAATGNSIFSNSIYDNDALGIDLIHSNDPAGVTPNDAGDGDGSIPPDPAAAPNRLQNYPVITSAKSGRRGTTIKGTMNSTAETTFILQFFSNVEADPSGHGEGQRFLGQKSVTTDLGGDANFTFKTKKKVSTGQVVSATATNRSTGDTSEFSEACTVPGLPCPP